MTGPESTPATNAMPQYGTPEELKAYLTETYSEDELKKMLIEVIATQDAAAEYYDNLAEGGLSDADAAAMTEKIRNEVNAAIERAGINMQLYAALTVLATEKGWTGESGFQEAVDARSEEINAARE